MDTEGQHTLERLADLRAQEAPPLDVDIHRAVTTGRKRVRTRRALTSVVAAAAAAIAVTGTVAGLNALGRVTPRPGTTAGVAPAAAAPACSVVALSVPGNAPDVEATAVDPTGKYVAGVVPGSEETGASGSALLWADGNARDLHVAGLAPTPKAVNSAGVVVGGTTRDHHLVAWVYRGGKVQYLAGIPGWDTEATGVNDNGEIVGVGYGPHDTTKALIWPAASSGKVQSLPAAGLAEALDVSGSGAVVGVAGYRPYLWESPLSGQALPALAGETKGRAMGISGDWAYGWSGSTKQPAGDAGGGPVVLQPGGEPSVAPDTVEQMRWVRWNVRDARVEELSGFGPAAIAATGEMAGTALTGKREAALFRDGAVVRLPHLTAQRDYSEAAGASADGRTVVGTESGLDGAKPVIWRC